MFDLKDLNILISSYRIVRDLDRATTKICSSYGITYPQFQVLEALLHKGNMTVGEIRDSIRLILSFLKLRSEARHLLTASVSENAISMLRVISG